MKVKVDFKQAGYAGDNVAYIAAGDGYLDPETGARQNSGWQNRGMWRVPYASAPAPGVVSVSPQGPGPGRRKVFTSTFQDATSYVNVFRGWMLFNYDLNGTRACYVGVDIPNGYIYLVDAAGAIAIGSNSTIENSQCIVYGSTSALLPSGTDVTMNIDVQFKDSLGGYLNGYFGTQTGSATGPTSGWHAMSAWKVP